MVWGMGGGVCVVGVAEIKALTNLSYCSQGKETGGRGRCLCDEVAHLAALASGGDLH